MKIYDIYSDNGEINEYIGQIACESVAIEAGKEYDRYIFRQGAYSTIIRTKCGIELLPDER